MNYLDLFSGIGGFALGAQWAGMQWKNHFNSDIDNYANKVYTKHFPKSIQLGDITKIDFKELKNNYPDEWIITGGFPCQDISIAGKGAGIEGDRSGLWFEMFRAIRILRSKFVIIENVGMLARRGLSTILGNLAEIGYDAEWQDIRASDVGLPHRRERIWIVAYSQSVRWYRYNTKEIKKFSQILPKQTFGQIAIPLSDEWYELSRSNKYLRTNNVLPKELDRLKCLGNSIVPQIAELLFNQIKLYLQETNYANTI